MNLWGKTRKIEEPYLIVSNGDWEWRVLKAYQARTGEKKNRYARWFCAVKSPLTYNSWELGDTYICDIPFDANNRETLALREEEEVRGAKHASNKKIAARGCGYLLFDRQRMELAPCGQRALNVINGPHGTKVPLCPEHLAFVQDAREPVRRAP